MLTAPAEFNAALTMFVYLKGHHLLEYYFEISDIRECSNEDM